MYFPFLRGKQYELLSLREFSKEIKSSKKISPIIEPVKREKKSIETALLQLVTNKVNFILIANPTIGEIEDPEFILRFIAEHAEISKYNNLQIGIHSFTEPQMRKMLAYIKEYGLGKTPLALIHNDVIANEDFVKTTLNARNIRYNLFNDTRIKAKRYRRLFTPDSLVILEDAFVAQKRNVDYLGQIDEFFSDEHLIYEDEGYVGFSDFLTIGQDYSDAGFMPYAVAIHLTYIAPDKSIRIRHFVSDTNEDYTDTPGKFAEALDKLIEAIPEITASYKTKAIGDFEAHHKAGHYPGLGSIKKLSILNHLELMKHLVK